MKKVYKILFALHLFVGMGAIAGGLAAITNPYEPLGMPIDLLKNSPFSNYLIPGIILFTIIGIGNIFSALAFRFKLKLQGYNSSIFSFALVIWIIIQCIILNTIAFLHGLFFLIGIIQAVLSISILIDKRLFPANIVLDYYNELGNKFKK